MKELVKSIQASMLAAVEVESVFEEEDRDHLRTLIRLAVEFYDHLKNGSPEPRKFFQDYLLAHPHLQDNISISADEYVIDYCIGSIFAGIESFTLLNGCYAILKGATQSAIEWDQVTVATLKDQFIGMFNDFVSETVFMRKCRLLLDLFKLQIVYSGMYYD